MQQNARQYANKLQWFTFPVNRDKTPRTKNGHNDASLDPSEFQWRGANLGIATGQSKLVVVDIDGPLGLTSWKAIAQDPCPTECVVKTAHGVHLYFSDPQGLYSTGHLAVNVDVRGVGGYVVAPPSMHESGVEYKWLKSSFPPPPVPEWLAGLLPRYQSADTEVCGSSEDATVQLLLEHGWKIVGGSEQNVYLKRPGKADKGHSVTWNGSVLFVHSTDAAPFEEGKGYNTKAVFGLLRGVGTPWLEEALENLWKAENWDEFFPLLAMAGASAIVHYRKAWDGGKAVFDTCHNRADRDVIEETKEQKRREDAFMSEDMIALYEKWGYHFRWNEDARDIDLNGEYFDDMHYQLLRGEIWDWEQDHGKRLPQNLWEPAFSRMAHQNPYSPLKEYLEGTKWDRKPRIKDLVAHFRVEGGKDQELLERFISHWIVGSVARAYVMYQNPMLVLSGPQGCGKSFFSKWLASGFKKYYHAGGVYPGVKDCRLRRCTTWIWEVEELGATTRKTDVGALKAFITQDENKDRKSYGRRDAVGRCIASYIGTVNSSDFLSDETGNRRFLPCALGSIDWAYSELDVNQVWAEALATFRTGDFWRLTVEELKAQEAATAKHLSGGVVAEFLPEFLEYALGERIRLVDILKELQMYNIRSSRAVKADITRTLKSWGGDRRRTQADKVQVVYYHNIRRKATEGDFEGGSKTPIYGVLAG